MVHREVGDRLYEPTIYVSWSISELSVSLEPLNMFKPSVSCFSDCSKIASEYDQEIP